ncbi:MAG: HAD family phosphatase [Verrucomicrobia bacterium]|nr:HAD family phosphatase [Verrucomicrobiota bacterium]
MKTLEAVVFDLGKVLVDFDYGIAATSIMARCDGRGCDLKKLIDQSDLLIRYETGLLTTEGFFAEVRDASGFLGDVAEFGPLFGNIFTMIDSMVAFNEALRARDIPTYIFSNTNELAIASIRERFPFFQNFTDFVFSYEHRSMKPDAKIYEVVERVCGKHGDAILYIDDRLENIEAGAKRGWQTIHHLSPETTLQRAKALGLPAGGGLRFEV